MEFKILYEDEDVLVIDKPAGIVADDIPRRVHRLDKDTSGVLLIAKNDKALEFLQKQFEDREVEKKYSALVVGNIKNQGGVGDEAKASSSPFAAARVIETLLGRSPKDRRKQKVYLPGEPDSQGKREAVTKYKVLRRFKDYDLIEVEPQTGRKHQIRTHLAYLGHPVVGDKLYGFKNQLCPKNLKRQFLHANYLKITLPNGSKKEFKSELPNELKLCLQNLKPL